ncbi:MAG: N-acetyl-gamma-glutamyl-phosphate reductase [Parvibaculaceae bacterium]|nr:N-acetyl-gamma-glutamyl-phosphate reductase [Parvibaculaceae bacterium]
MSIRVFIDGEAGTTGLQIRARLEARSDISLIRLEGEQRKDRDARREALNSADAVILCLPDDAAREAVSLIDNDNVRVIDASTAYRTAPGWVYGFAEMTPGQRAEIARAKRVSNPGCYPTGFIGLVRPLIDAGLLPKDWPVTVNAVSGYSGGGKAMVSEFEDESAENYCTTPYRIYATGLEHKHVDEMRVHTGLAHRPLFAPSVGRYYKGMIVEVPLQLWALPGAPSPHDLRMALVHAYKDQHFVEVADYEETLQTKLLDPEGLNDTNRMKLFVFGNETRGQARLVALLDNLGKGASGAAVQNLNIMLGLDERLGL